MRRGLPKEQLAAAADAVRALTQSRQPDSEQALGRSNSVPKRKRTQPLRSASCKSFKADAANAAAAV